MDNSGSESVALTAGGIAALLAGACCVAPLALVSMGLGGAWLANLQLLAPYRPLFISVALATLGFAGWRIYRPATECKPGEVCAVPQVRRGYRIGFWIVAALLVAMLGFPYAALAENRTVTLSVPGMSCDLCPLTIKKAISKVPGVSNVDASYEKKQAVVTFDDATTTVEALTRASANAGYPATLKP